MRWGLSLVVKVEVSVKAAVVCACHWREQEGWKRGGGGGKIGLGYVDYRKRKEEDEQGVLEFFGDFQTGFLGILLHFLRTDLCLICFFNFLKEI